VKKFDVTFPATLTMSIEAHSAADAEAAARIWFDPKEPRDPLQGVSVNRALLPEVPFVGEARVMTCTLHALDDVGVTQTGGE
jgi:hypothetical protein